MRSILYLSLKRSVILFLFLVGFSLYASNEVSGNDSKSVTYSIEEFEECAPFSPAINFTPLSLFVGAGRNSVWVRAAINEPGNVYVALYTADPGALTGATIRTHAITAGAQIATEVPGSSPVGTTSQQQQFTAANVPSFPSFPGTPYAGSRFTTLAFGTTYHYRIVARDAGGTNFSPIISGTITTAADLCTLVNQGSTDTGSSANVCGPRTVQFNMTLTGTRYGDPYLLQYRFFFLYETNGIGAPFTNVSPTLTNPTELNRDAQVWTASQTNIYPDNGTICAYNARAYLAYSDQGLCPVFQGQTFEVFDDIANTNLGQIGIAPPLPTGIEVCEGSTATVNFTNTSVINCVAPEEMEKKNTYQRWYQYEYGTNFAAGDFMDKVQVVIPAGTPNYPPGANPFFPGGGTITTFATAYRGPIVMLPAAVDETTPLPPSFNINVLNTNVFGPDNRFRVTLRMWNVCNPYDNQLDVPFGSGGLAPTTGDIPNGDADPITTFSEIILVQEPPIPTAVPRNICQGSGLGNFQISYAGASTSVRWFDDNAGVIGALVATTGPNSTTLSAGTAGITPVPNSGTPAVYAVWASYQRPTTGTVQCFSDPVRTTITVKESPLPTPPAFTTSSTQVCQGDVNVLYQLPVTSPTQTVGGATQYEWIATDNADVPVADVTITPQANNRSVLVNFPVPGSYTTRTRKIRVRSIYSAGQACPSNYRDVTVTVFGPSQATTINPVTQTICDGGTVTSITASGLRGTIQGWERSVNGGGFVADGTLGVANPITPTVPLVGGVQTTYRYRAVVQNGTCAAVNSPVATIIVNPIPPKPTITPSGATTFCDGGSVTLTSSDVGGLASSYRWYRNGTLTGTVTQNIVINTVAQSGSYTVEVVGVGTSFCVSPPSDPIVVTINALPTANLTGGGSICSGGLIPAPDVVFTFTGAGPWDLIYSINGVNQPVVNNTTSPFNIVNPAAGTYAIVSVTDSNTPACAVTAPSANITGGATVTVQPTPPPALQSFTVTAPVCDDGAGTNPPDALLALSPDSPQFYNISYTINGVPFTENNKGTNPVGDLTLTPPYTAWGSAPGSYVITVTALVNTATLCAGVVPIISPPLVVNPRPTAPTGPVNGIACSVPGTGAALSVNDPGAGFEIEWSTAGPNLASFVAAVPGSGAESGANNRTFTPTTSATATFYAFTRNTATGCFSPTGTAVTQTQDVRPTPAVAGPPQPLLCGTSTTMAATAVNNGGTGTWTVVSPIGPPIVITSPNSPTTTVTGLPQDVPGGAPIITTLRWTATSALGICAPTFADVQLTVNPLPVVNNLTPILCEDVFGGASTANVNLATNYDTNVMGGTPANTVVHYFPSAADRIANTNEILAPITVTNGMIRFTRVQNTVTNCISDGTITFTVRTLPIVVNHSAQVCEDAPPGSLVASGINLQNFETTIANGSMVNRDIEWYTDASLGAGFLIPPGVAAGAEQNYSISADVTLHAKVIDTTLPSPQCFRAATLNLDYQARPNNNQITDGIGQVLGATYTVCASSNLVLLQINPGINPGSTYTWTIPPPSFPGEFELLTGTSGFFVILRFPNPIASPGIPITVKETLGTALCDGNVMSTSIIVEGSPPKPIISGPSSVCTNQSGVVFTVTNPVAGTYSWSLPAGATITSLPVTASSITVQMSTFSGNVTVTHASGTGCTSPAADPFPVTVVNRPTITSASTATLCSGDNVSAIHTLASNIVGTTYNWDVINITGSVLGTLLGNTATGVLSINETLSNFSGVTATVTYRITPIGPGPDNCPGTPQNFTVTVNPEPVIVTSQTKTICSGAPVAKEILLAPANLPAGTLFNWPDPDGGGGPATAGVNIPMGVAGTIHINDVLSNLTNAPIVVNYVVTPISGAGCDGVPQVIAITVNPQPVGASDTPLPVCSGVVAGYDLEANIATLGNNLIAGTTYSWVATANGNVSNESTTPQSGKIITDVLRNFTTSNQVVRYTITPTSGAGCVGAAFTVDVTVRPEPVGFNDASPIICSDANVNYNLVANIANTVAGGNNLTIGTTYSWIAAANLNVTGESTVAQAGSVITDVLNNITNNSHVVVYTVTPTSVDGCVGAPFTVSVTVRPEPKGYNDASPIICSDGAVNYNIESNILNTGLGGNGLISGTTYAWAATANANVGGEGSGTGSIITNVLNNITNVNQVVDYTVTATSADGCVGDPFVVSVTVRPEPRGFNDPSPSVCSDGTVNYSLSANIANTGAGGNNLTAGTTYSWSAASNPSVSGESTSSQASGTINDVLNNITNSVQTVVYTVIPTSGGGCVGDAFTVSVTVNPEPKGYNDISPVTCSDVALAYDLSTNIANTVAGGNNLVTGTTYSWVAASNATVTGESTVPQAGVIINDVINNVTNSNQTVVYTVTATNAGCVGDPFTVSVTVRPEPRGFNDNSPIVCSDVALAYSLSANIANTGAGGNNLAIGTTYSWIAADNPSVTGESLLVQTSATINNVLNNVTAADEQVVYTVTPTSADGCVGDVFTVTVTVRPEPRGFNDVATICSDAAVGYDLAANIANTVSGGNNLVTGTTYSWVAANNVNVGGESVLPQTGSIITDVLNNITNSDQTVSYTITPTSGLGCVGNAFTVAVTVQPEPKGYNDPTPFVCSDAAVNYDLSTNIANIGLGGNNLIAGTTYSWVAASNATVTGESTVAQAGSIITDVLNNVTNSNQVVVYTITPTSVNGCVGNPFTVSVTVRPEPVGFNDARTVCSDVAINYNLINNISNTGAGGNNLVTGTTYSWIAADNPSVTGETTGAPGTASTIGDVVTNITNVDQPVVYTVTPTSSDGCVGNPFTVTVTVQPEPKGYNDAMPLACSDVAFNYDLAANLANIGLGGNNLVIGTTYSWVATANAFVTGEGSGTGSIITDVITNITNATQIVIYTVTPTSGAGCVGNAFTVSINVRPEPRGFTDLTPVICSDAAVGYDLATNIANTVAGGNNLVTGTTYSWIATNNANVGGESTVAQAGSIITDILNNITNSNQVVLYTITPTSANGCAGDPFQVSVTVRPEPRGFNDIKTICSDANVNYDITANIGNTGSGGNNLLIGTTYSWIAANNVDVTGESFVTPGTSTSITDVLNNITNIDQVVVYTVTPTSNNGCVGDPFTVTVTVRPEPKGFNDNSTIICSDGTVNYSLAANIANTVAGGNNLVIGTTYSWVAALNPSVAGESTVAQAGAIITDILNNVTNIDQVVTYTVTPTSSLGCVGNPFTVDVTVRPEPKGFDDNSPIICSDASVNYDLTTNISNTVAGGNNLVAGTTYSWLAADNPSVTGETLIATNTTIINDLLNNVTGSNQLVVYTITPTSINGCLGNPFTVSVTVRPEPVGLADVDDVCSDEQINYNIQTMNINLLGNSVASQFTYTVVSSDPGNVSVAGKNRPVASVAPITDTYTNTTSADVLITYTITPFSTTGTCAGAPFDVVITIHPEPRGPNTTIQICSDVPLNYDLQDIVDTPVTGNAVPSKFRYSVSSNNPLAVAPGPNRNTASAAPITDVYTNITATDVEITYTVTPVSLANDCEGTSFTFKVIVNPEPVGANVVDPVCSTALNYNIQTQNINALGNGVPSVFTYTVTSSDPIGVPPAADRVVASNLPITDSYINSTGVDVTVTYTITPSSAANGCLGTPFTYAVTISSKPVGANVTKTTVCSDVAFSFNPQADITNGVIATFTWTASYQPGLTVGGSAPPASGTGLIAGSLTNTGNSVLNATYTVIPTAGTCIGDPFDIVVPIDPEPVVATNLNAIVCSGDPYNTLLNTNGVSIGATTYDVSAVVDAGLTGTPTTGLGLADNALLNDAFTNVTAVPLKVTYTITPHGTNTCVGDPKTVELTVNPEPVINPSLDNTVCSREISGIILSTNGTSVAANSYRLVNVTVPGTITADPLNTTPGTTSNINLIRNDKYTNNTSGPVVVVYEVVGISPAPASCEGQPELINLTINPEPILQPGNATLCSDVPSGIVVGPAAGSAVITQYELKSIVKAPALVAGGSNAGLGMFAANLPGGQSDFLANDVFTNTTSGPLNVTYTVVPIASGCRGQDQTILFTVNPAPALDDNLNRIVCSNDVAGIVFATETSPASPAAVSYNIVTINVAAGLIRTAGNAAFPRNGVTANDIQLDQFRNPTNDPLVVTYTVEGVSAVPCTGPTRNILLTVEPEIIAAPVNNAPTICSADKTNIDLISPTNPTLGGITFNYTAVSSVGGLISGFVPAANNLPENYKIEDALVNNSDNPETVTYSITAMALGAKGGAGCSSLPPPVSVVVTVEPKPKLVASPAIQTVCEGIASNITLNSNTVPSAGNTRFELMSATATGSVTGMTAVGTMFNPGSSLADVLDNPTTTAQTVIYTFQPKIIGGLGCVGDNVLITVTVNPNPVITASPQPDICSGDFVNITLTPDVTNTIAQWTVTAPPTITGASNGAGNLIFQTLFNNGNIPETVTYNLVPRANGCNGTPLVISVVVNPKPKFVGLPTTVTVCHGGTLNVPLTSTVAGTTFDWVVDDPSGLGVPVTGSGPVINQVLNNTTGSQASLTYTITPTGPGNCPGDQKILIVTVSPEMDATFLNTNSSICKGSSEFLIFELQGQAPFQLVYNDGTSNITLNNSGNVKVVQVTPTVTTTYSIVSIRDALNCTFTPVGQSVMVTVGETDATFSVVGPTASCGPYNATFQFNQVTGTEYTWQWFDGSPDDVFLAATTVPNQTISHTFDNPNPNAPITYKVTLRTQLPAPFPGCFKSTTQNITVYPSIITNAFPDRSEICSGESIQFFNQSFGVTTHRWFYRVQGTGTEIDVRTTPTVNYTFTNTTTNNPIIYEVVYQANNGNCPAPDVVMPITVYRGITAGFDEGTVPPFVGGNSTVTFTNTSTPIDATQFRYEWDFGLNATPLTATGAGPFSVNYSTPGPRDVRLRVVNIAAETAGMPCESSYSETINIPVLPLVAAFTADPQRACFPSDITVTSNTSTGDLMEWRVVDSNGRITATSNAPLPVFRITTPGEYSIFLTTSNSITGQVANSQQDGFEIFDNPMASFDLRPSVVYVPDTELTTFNFSLDATDYLWDFGDGGTSTEIEPVYVYKVEGAYEVTLIAQNDHGGGVVCSDTLKRNVTAKQGGVTKVPNAFTPSTSGPNGGTPGSGANGTFNDVFLPIVKGAEEFNMQIFDRWGNLIFESNSSNVGWDGYDEKGRLMPAGVYVYKLTIRLSDGQRSTQIGDVTMIR